MDTELATTGKPPRVPLTLREGKALGRKAEEGDKKARVGFREWLQNEGACYIDEIGSPQTMALENVVSMFANGHPACEESATEKLAKLHAALAGEHPSLLEVLLVQRVVYCWFVLWTLEDRQANGGYGFESTSSMTYLDRRISHANRRFLSSVKALAVFRKLDAATVLSVTQSVTESVTLTASSERTQQPSSSEKPR